MVEMTLRDAFRAIHDGGIIDAKTILLVQHLAYETNKSTMTVPG